MMRKAISFIPLLLLLTFVLFGCNGKQDKAPDTQLTFEQTLTAEDTTAIRNLVDQYFQQVMNGNYYEAAAMLYNPSMDNRYGEPKPLDNDQMQKVVGLLKSIPVVDYEIEYMMFDDEVHNEVMCNVIMIKASENTPGYTTKFAFCPLRYMGYWVLCIDDFETGTSGMGRSAERDSLRRLYEAKKADSIK